MRIIRTRLPDTESTSYAVLRLLASSWYIHGLSSMDVAALLVCRPDEASASLSWLYDQGLVELTPRSGYVITDRAKELLDAERQ